MDLGDRDCFNVTDRKEDKHSRNISAICEILFTHSRLLNAVSPQYVKFYIRFESAVGIFDVKSKFENAYYIKYVLASYFLPQACLMKVNSGKRFTRNLI